MQRDQGSAMADRHNRGPRQFLAQHAIDFGLHFLVRQATAIDEHGERITRERCAGEYVELNEIVAVRQIRKYLFV